MRNEGEQGLPDAWGVHLLTDDVEAVAKATPEHGGSVAFEPMVVGENGSSTLVKDPGGAMVGAWQPNQMKGFEVTGEPGTPAWFELHTRAYEPAVAFYRDVFGWDAHVVSDTDEFRYTTLGEGEGQLAGIMDDSPYPGDESGYWAVYFAVPDADAAIARIEELGGSVVRPPRTRRTAGSRPSPTRPARSSASSRTTADLPRARQTMERCQTPLLVCPADALPAGPGWLPHGRTHRTSRSRCAHDPGISGCGAIDAKSARLPARQQSVSDTDCPIGRRSDRPDAVLSRVRRPTWRT